MASCLAPRRGLRRPENRLRRKQGLAGPRAEARGLAVVGVVAKWLGNGLQNRHTWVRIPSTPRVGELRALVCRTGATATVLGSHA